MVRAACGPCSQDRTIFRQITFVWTEPKNADSVWAVIIGGNQLKRIACFALLAFSLGGPSLAQSTTAAVIAPPGGADEFCYYGGLAYSKNAILVIDVNNRRESPQSTQKALLKCEEEEGSEDLQWVRQRDE